MMINKSYKHWMIVFLMCCLAASSIGLCTNAIGVFYTPVSKSLHVLKGTFAMHATLSTLITALTSLKMSKLIRKYNYKKILLIGVLLSSVSTWMMSYSRSVYLFYILGILRGIGVGIGGMVPITVIITNWFDEKHGLATGLALSFSGLAGAIFSPLLSSWITCYGWQMTYRLMAICIFILVFPVLIVPWKINPQEENLLPYGYQERKDTIKIQDKKISLITISFLCMCLFTLLHTSITGISQYLSGIALSIHLSATSGAILMSLTMIGNISTKLLIGFLSDLLNPIKAVIIMILTNCLSLLLLFLGVIHQEIMLLYIGSFMFGSIYSVGAVGIPMLTRYFFGNENYARTYSFIGFLTNVGSASSLTLIGYLYDFTQSYQMVFIIALCFHLINLILLVVICLRYNGVGDK
ncbi:MFS transporter [Faecalibacillus intestinalis]|uniref:MFS transporter n=1 Tax=Faecalibacillus intestinalis TaxID=1982626 RepID=A0AAW4VS46_9FIRM|nr:MFS transporter [Faecalibacillus intestinalis]MCB8562455.1 MFS transporter [Faecalibacillus intestinalis]MCG4810554.1 MFS transporter [Faecalibacillus intestinalis]